MKGIAICTLLVLSSGLSQAQIVLPKPGFRDVPDILKPAPGGVVIPGPVTAAPPPPQPHPQPAPAPQPAPQPHHPAPPPPVSHHDPVDAPGSGVIVVGPIAPLPANPPPPGQDLEAQRREEERRRREVEIAARDRALRAESHLVISAAGIDSQDCLNRLMARAYQAEPSVVRDCDLQANPIFSCRIVSRLTQDFSSPISAVFGSGDFDEKNSNEATCRSSAIYQAESNAVSNCQQKFGVSCDVTSRGTASHETHKRRKYIIFGPYQQYDRCSASAMAEPRPEYTRQCSLRLEARPIVF